MTITEKGIWGYKFLEKLLIEESKLNFDEMREKIIIEGAEAGYNFTDEEAIQIIRASDSYSNKVITSRSKHMARKKFDSVSLYPGIPENFEDAPHWTKYVENLRKQGWPESVIKSLDEHCSAIVDAILDGNNQRPGLNSERVKGLIVGHVQSGKTANMAGVMALCADKFNVDLIIVFSGVHNKLNSQTTRRFEKDLWTYKKWSREENLDRAGIEHIQSNKMSWSNITVDDDNLRNTALHFSQIVCPAFGVFKKNSSILETLRRKIEDNPPNERQSMKVLIIDDECDQASPDVGDEENPSTINEKIWEIMNLLPDSTYIGYTATPFASILNENPGRGSLYPSSFIYKLPKNPTYFGVKEFFGTEEVGDDGLDIIRIVPEIEDDEIIDSESARNAIGYFICSSAARRYLRDSDGHFSMLVHTSHKKDEHAEVAVTIDEIVRSFRSLSDDVYYELKSIWDSELNKISKQDLVKYNGGSEADYNLPEPFDSFKNFIPDVLDSLEIRVDNSDSESRFERLDYDSDEPLTLIAIGGNTLSRGLTLEGLNVTYFTRPGRQYDSLLQMGRWFGYRIGYEDLVRAWTTRSNEDSFRYICMVEEDLRDQIEELYENTDASPDEVSLAVLSHPTLRIVRSSAMREAESINTSYFGTAPQTIYFKRTDRDWLINNWNAGQELLGQFDESYIKPGFENHNKRVFLSNHEAVINFFSKVYTHDRQHRQMHSDDIKSFIQNASSEGYLKNWHIAVAENLKDQTYDGTSFSHYNPTRRSRLKDESDPNVANIRALRSPGDLYIDFLEQDVPQEHRKLLDQNKPSSRSTLLSNLKISEKQMPGLLLLYPIDRNSDSAYESRTKLDAEYDVLGWSVIFPYPKPTRELIERVGINLNS